MKSKCNCRNKGECPLENKCLTPRVIYEADVITLNTSRKFHIGLSDTPFKERYNNHKRDFRLLQDFLTLELARKWDRIHYTLENFKSR